MNRHDAERWSQYTMMLPLNFLGLLVYGGGSLALPIILAHRGQLWELFTFEGVVFWGWGLFSTAFLLYYTTKVISAWLYLRRAR